jgi:hypothetical protein
MSWFVHGFYWHSVYTASRMLQDSEGSVRGTLRSLGILKRNDYRSTPTGMTMHDALTSRGCVYLKRPTEFQREIALHRLPVARLAGRDIDQNSGWTIVEMAYEWRNSVPQPAPDCFPTLGADMRSGWTQSANFSSSCLSVLISSVALSSRWSARRRTGSHTWTTPAIS